MANLDTYRLSDHEQDLYIALHVIHRIPDPLQTRPSMPLPAIEYASSSDREGKYPDLHLASDPSEDILKATESSSCDEVAKTLPDRKNRDYKKRVYKKRVSHKKRSCKLLDLPVCQRACARLLSIGTSQVERVRRGEASLRHCPKPRHPTLGFVLNVPTV